MRSISVSQMPATGDIIDFGGGNAHLCALTAAGRVSCWGTTNASGQLGRDPLNSSSTMTPVDVGLSDVIQVSARRDNTCAMRSTGQVQCWGANARGQIGDGNTGGDRLVPSPVSGL
jgi:alpha-tubulin suppressor-like RCC1 family protein